MRCLTVLILLASILTSSCISHTPSDKSNQPKGASATNIGHEYFPIADGSKWEYSIDYARSDIGVQKGKVVTRVDGQETIDDQIYFKLVTVSSGVPGAESTVEYYRNANDGLYQRSAKGSSEILFLPAPLEIGKTWTIADPTGDIHYRIEAIETAELFDTKYESCFKISFDRIITNEKGKAFIKGYEYRARGIGIVKSVTEIEPKPKRPQHPGQGYLYPAKVTITSSLDSHK